MWHCPKAYSASQKDKAVPKKVVFGTALSKNSRVLAIFLTKLLAIRHDIARNDAIRLSKLPEGVVARFWDLIANSIGKKVSFLHRRRTISVSQRDVQNPMECAIEFRELRRVTEASGEFSETIHWTLDLWETEIAFEKFELFKIENYFVIFLFRNVIIHNSAIIRSKTCNSCAICNYTRVITDSNYYGTKLFVIRM